MCYWIYFQSIMSVKLSPRGLLMKCVFSSIEEGMRALQAGRMIILVDEHNRENEGDLVIAAEHITADAINFMVRFGRGLICLPMVGEMIDKLQLPMMTCNNGLPFGTAFTVSIEAASGVSTGISAADRAHTIKIAVSQNSSPHDIVTPGHIFPLRAAPRGVLERPGHTEGSVDLVKLAGLTPAAVVCEIMNDDGTMSRNGDLAIFAQTHAMPILKIQDLIDYRMRHEVLVTTAATATLPLKNFGDFTMTVFNSLLDGSEHFALMKPPAVINRVPLVRIHSECVTGDVLGSCKCDCGAQLEQSLAMLAVEGGVLIYLRQEGRGLGLANKLKAYALQEQGFDTVDANIKLGLPIDNRDYAVAYQILNHFGISILRLLTNNPYKVANLEKYGLKISERISLITTPTVENYTYLKTKQTKLGHLLAIAEAP